MFAGVSSPVLAEEELPIAGDGTPATTIEEPATDPVDPGTTVDPGTEDPGTVDPGTNPGGEDPGTDPGTEDPGTVDPGTTPSVDPVIPDVQPSVKSINGIIHVEGGGDASKAVYVNVIGGQGQSMPVAFTEGSSFAFHQLDANGEYSIGVQEVDGYTLSVSQAADGTYVITAIPNGGATAGDGQASSQTDGKPASSGTSSSTNSGTNGKPGATTGGSSSKSSGKTTSKTADKTDSKVGKTASAIKNKAADTAAIMYSVPMMTAAGAALLTLGFTKKKH